MDDIQCGKDNLPFCIYQSLKKRNSGSKVHIESNQFVQLRQSGTNDHNKRFCLRIRFVSRIIVR